MLGAGELLILFMAIAILASPVIAIIVVLRIKKNRQRRVDSTGDRLMQRARQQLKENRAAVESPPAGGQ